MEKSCSHYCSHCKKNYSCRQNLLRHNKRFHGQNGQKVSQKVSQDYKKVSQKVSHFDPPVSQKVSHEKKYKCKKCDKKYVHKQSCWKHEKKCTFEKPDYEDMYTKLKSDLLKLMNKKYKVHHNTLKKLCKDNNIEIDNSITNNILTNSNNVNSNNQINSNNTTINIIALGGEELPYVLSKKEQLKILNSGYMSLNKLIEYVHFNDNYPQFQNIAITNLNNPYAYQYDESKNKYIVCKKDELIRDVIEFRMIDIDDFYKKYGGKLNDKMKKVVQDLIDKMDEDDINNLQLEKTEQVKILMYNNSNVIDNPQLK